MWSSADILLEIEEAEHPVAIIRIYTPVGQVAVIGEIRLAGKQLSIMNAHIQELHPGALGRTGSNVIARKLLEETDAYSLIVQGGPRTTGACPGYRPRPFRFPR